MTEIVGILNVTPDSFSDGGKYHKTEKALRRVAEMFEEGADSIDIGAESTRPGASGTAIKEEWSRLEPVLQALGQHYPAQAFSIDTHRAEIAEQAVNLWSRDLTINDVTGLSGQRMVDVVAAQGLRVVIGHLPTRARGNIARSHHQARMTSQWEVRDQLITTYLKAVGQGVQPENIILDPGIGFGKSAELNRQLIGFASLVPNIPVMVGYSCKRFLGPNALSPSINCEMGRRAIHSGAAFLRVHDVAAHRKMLREEMKKMTKKAML